MAIFVELNGYRLEAPEEEVVQAMLTLADRPSRESQLVAWLANRLVRAR